MQPLMLQLSTWQGSFQVIDFEKKNEILCSVSAKRYQITINQQKDEFKMHTLFAIASMMRENLRKSSSSSVTWR